MGREAEKITEPSSLFHLSAPAAKSLQSCPTLCNPIDGSPPGFPVPGILQARTLEWVAIAFSDLVSLKGVKTRWNKKIGGLLCLIGTDDPCCKVFNWCYIISVRFQSKPFNITVIQVYAPTSKAEEAEVVWFIYC